MTVSVSVCSDTAAHTVGQLVSVCSDTAAHSGTVFRAVSFIVCIFNQFATHSCVFHIAVYFCFITPAVSHRDSSNFSLFPVVLIIPICYTR